MFSSQIISRSLSDSNERLLMTNAGQLRVISSSSSLFLNINSYRVLGFLCGALPFPCVSVFDPSPLLNRYLPQGDHVPG